MLSCVLFGQRQSAGRDVGRDQMGVRQLRRKSDRNTSAAGANIGNAIELAVKDLSYAVSNCPDTPSHTQLAHECLVVAVRDAADQLASDPSTPGAAETSLHEAAVTLALAAAELAKGSRKTAADYVLTADAQLDDAIQNGADSATDPRAKRGRLCGTISPCSIWSASSAR